MLLFLNIGTSEIILIILVIVIFFGPKKIPELAKSFGKAINNFNQAADKVKEEINREVVELQDAGDETKPKSEKTKKKHSDE
ncbi:MAG: twin-arginine translocase TatA/TatE family subunit [Bacteroidetes bacterium]|nr:twin-arginine translocase TatA/TatE family subunit [Bacteroidota bacterium]MBU1720618.1 twin-arginine translocase TatA/TatE family subunit [Bacteroidota bacterium]